ncbi:MAG: hypothetical protein ACI8W8_004233 [Rhodothermales bacterium]|jgi:hypothetical protein
MSNCIPIGVGGRRIDNLVFLLAKQVGVLSRGLAYCLGS